MNKYEAGQREDELPLAAGVPSDLRDPLACFPAGVVLATCEQDEGRIGVLVRSFAVLSPASALVAWTSDLNAPGASALRYATRWAAHVLAYNQVDLAAQLASGQGDGMGDARVKAAVDGVPVLEGCAASLSCRHVTSFVCENSLIVVGRVVGFARNDVPPLIRHDGAEAVAIDIGGHLAGQQSTTATSLAYLLGSAFFYLYGKMRDVGGRLGFDNIEMFVLTALGERGGRTRQEIETLLAYSAHPTSLDAMDDLEASGLIVSREAANSVVSDTTFFLTPAGTEIFERFRQAGQHVQSDMEDLLGLPEAVALRALLGRFAGKIDGGPVAWL